MKILHIITDFYGNGGAEKMLANVVEMNADVEHHVISLMTPRSRRFRSEAGCKSLTQFNWNFWNTPIILFKLVKYFNGMDAKVVQCWMYHSNMLAAIASMFTSKKINIIWSVHHSLTDYKSESLPVKISISLGKFFRGIPSAAIFCSLKSKEQHEKILYTTKKNVYIPNGVDLNKFTANNPETGKINFVVGTAGRLHNAKGYKYLLSAVKAIKDLHLPISFKLAGTGVTYVNPEFKKLMDQSNLSENDVQLCGNVEDMVGFYKTLDIFILSSITEGFPNVLIEALASGLTCLSTDVGDASIIVDDDRLLIRPKDAEDIVRVLLRYIDMSEVEKNQIFIKNKNNLVRFDLVLISKKYMDLWSSF